MEEPKSTILGNAVQSIELGINDYQQMNQGKKARVLSAIRNIYAGILLLLKEELHRRSPKGSNDVWLMEKYDLIVDSNGNTTKVQGHKGKTVNYNQIKERYELLRIPVKNWSALESIQKERNNIEHRYSSKTVQDLRPIIDDAVVFISDILANVLEEQPDKLLGSTWKKMLDIQSVYEIEKKECAKSIAPLLENHILDNDTCEILKSCSCPNCRSDLLKVDLQDSFFDREQIMMSCRKCGKKISIVTLFEEYAYAKYGPDIDMQRAGEQGDVSTCPSCRHDTFIEADEVNRCIFCEHTKQNTHCIRCGCEITVDEDEDNGGYCWDCEYELARLETEDF